MGETQNVSTGAFPSLGDLRIHHGDSKFNYEICILSSKKEEKDNDF